MTHEDDLKKCVLELLYDDEDSAQCWERRTLASEVSTCFDDVTVGDVMELLDRMEENGEVACAHQFVFPPIPT